MKRSDINPPVVSVIVPNYNHAAFLRERLDSVLNQTFGNYEIIILDDCSTDQSGEVIASYSGNDRVSHVVVNNQNSGSTFAQWCRGLQLARGRYVWIAESDDVAKPEFLQTLVDELEGNPEAVLAYSQSDIIDADGQIIDGADWDRIKSGADVDFFEPQDMVRRNLLCNNGIYNASMAVFRRDAAPEITDELMQMRYCGDWLFWFKLACRGSAIRVNRKLNAFRQHDNKVSPGASKQGLTYKEGLKIINRMADFLQLNKCQRKVLTGRTLKRLRRYPQLAPQRNEAIKRELETLLGSPLSSAQWPLIMTYELDKVFNFSHLLR